MVRKIRARVRDGRLELQGPLDLPERADVLVTVEEIPDPVASREAFEKSAGAWKAKVDADDLIRMVYEARLGPGPQSNT